jgi:hypothetical protein
VEYVDEKASDTKEHIPPDTDSDIGEVCEDIRAIDMDADGKEKPIGMLVHLPLYAGN